MKSVSVLLKTKINGWYVYKTTDYNDDGKRIGTYWELYASLDPDYCMVNAFTWRKGAELWAKDHPNMEEGNNNGNY